MAIFYLQLIIILSICSLGDLVKKRKKIFAGIIFIGIIILLALVAGLRWGIGDTGAYVHLYNILDFTGEVKGYEPGFIEFFRTLKYINKDPQFMIFVTAMITTILNLWILKKYTVNFTLVCYLYITSGYYIVTMNGIRQALVASFILVGTIFIEKNKFLPYLFICVFMSTFHFSALMMIPVYFVVKKKSWSKELYILLGISIVVLIFYPYIENIIFSLLGKYDHYKDFNEGGANLLRILVAIVPVAVAYLKREYIENNWKSGNIFVNMSILNAVIMCFSYYNWIFARFIIYTQPYTFVLLAYLVTKCFKRKEMRIILYLLILLYFIFFWYDAAIILNMQYKSNYF